MPADAAGASEHASAAEPTEPARPARPPDTDAGGDGDGASRPAPPHAPHPLPLTRGARDRIARLTHAAQRRNVIARLLTGLPVPPGLWRPHPAEGDLPELRLDDSTIVAWRTLERMARAAGHAPRGFLEHVDALVRRDCWFDALPVRLADVGPGDADDAGGTSTTLAPRLDAPLDATDALAAVEPAAALLAWTDDDARPTAGGALVAFADVNGPLRVLAVRRDAVGEPPSVIVHAAWSGGVPVHRDGTRLAAIARDLVAAGRLLDPVPSVLHAWTDGPLTDADADAIVAPLEARPRGERREHPAAWRRAAGEPRRIERAFGALGAALGIEPDDHE